MNDDNNNNNDSISNRQNFERTLRRFRREQIFVLNASPQQRQNHIRAQREMQLASVCTAIRNNDPNMTAFAALGPQPPGYAQRLGDALLGNTHVERIGLSLHHSLLVPENGIHYDVGDERLVSNLLQYLRTGRALRHVELRGGDMEYVQMVLLALSQSPCIESLYVSSDVDLDSSIMAATMAHLLRSTSSSLRSITMPLTDIEAIASALVAHRTMTDLHVTFKHSTIRGDIFSFAAAQLSPSCLTRLTIVNESQIILPSIQLHTAVCQFLEKVARSLDFLQLTGFVFDKERMRLLLNSVQFPPLLHSLLLDECVYNDDAAVCFVDFWQNSGVTNGVVVTNTSESQAKCGIKELGIIGDINGHGSVLLSTTTSAATNMGQMLALSLRKSCSLERLRWQPCIGKCETFWNTLSEHASEIRLSCIDAPCRRSDEDAFNAMLACVRKLKYLRKVPGTWLNSHLDRPFLDMIRKNGSLYSFACKFLPADPLVAQRIQAYFQRNEQLPQLLRNPIVLHDTEHHPKEHVTTVPTAASIHLFPQLFAAAKPAAYHAPTNILIGVLSLQNAIGPMREMQQQHQRRQKLNRKRSRVG